MYELLCFLLLAAPYCFLIYRDIHVMSYFAKCKDSNDAPFCQQKLTTLFWVERRCILIPTLCLDNSRQREPFLTIWRESLKRPFSSGIKQKKKKNKKKKKKKKKIVKIFRFEFSILILNFCANLFSRWIFGPKKFDFCSIWIFAPKIKDLFYFQANMWCRWVRNRTWLSTSGIGTTT